MTIKMRNFIACLLPLVVMMLPSCELTSDGSEPIEPEDDNPTPSIFYRGGDLSYVNEMEDCSALYYTKEGVQQDPYAIFAEAGTDLVRLRLWHNPDWTDYSNFADVKRSIARAKALDMKVLLDFHYSDDWADPGVQHVPAAWLPVVDNIASLGDSVYNYTFSILEALDAEGLLPDIVQVGNETNIEILQDPDRTYNIINWSRNAYLLNKGLQAVRDAADQFEATIESMLHIAQPENAEWFFRESRQNGVTDFDWIGLSYYPLWSNVALNDLGTLFESIKSTHNKRVMIVETAYPFTLENNDAAGNILGTDAVIPGYAISPLGQLDFLQELERQIIQGGGEGLIYWEPAWVSNTCSTRWGDGSHWDNATLFDHNHRANLGMNYYRGE
jgi:arabinogalactan endo-1,4-beta-galactosidase